MIPLFKDNNINSFSVKKIDSELENKFNIIKEKINYKPERKIVIIQSVLTFISFIFIFAIISLGFDWAVLGNLKDAWKENSIFYTIMCVIGFPSMIIKMFFQAKQRKFMSKDLMREIDKEFKEFNEMHTDFFNIPKDRNMIDVLIPTYKNNIENQIKENICFDIYKKNECICLTDNFQELSIPIKDITISLIEEEVFFMPWNKEERFDSIYYKNHNLKYRKKKFIIDSYARVIVKNDNQEYYFDLPGYEYNQIKRLL